MCYLSRFNKLRLDILFASFYGYNSHITICVELLPCLVCISTWLWSSQHSLVKTYFLTLQMTSLISAFIAVKVIVVVALSVVSVAVFATQANPTKKFSIHTFTNFHKIHTPTL